MTLVVLEAMKMQHQIAPLRPAPSPRVSTRASRFQSRHPGARARRGRLNGTSATISRRRQPPFLFASGVQGQTDAGRDAPATSWHRAVHPIRRICWAATTAPSPSARAAAAAMPPARAASTRFPARRSLLAIGSVRRTVVAFNDIAPKPAGGISAEAAPLVRDRPSAVLTRGHIIGAMAAPRWSTAARIGNAPTAPLMRPGLRRLGSGRADRPPDKDNNADGLALTSKA